VYLEKEFQDTTIRNPVRIEKNLYGLGVSAVVSVGGIGDITTGVPHPGGLYARQLANQILHAPKAAACQNCAFLCHYLSSTHENKNAL
jgi:hypothetical protein